MATYPDDATYNSTSMANRKPDRGFTSNIKFKKPSNSPFTSNAGYEKSTLRSRRYFRDYKLTYTNVTLDHVTAMENFYIARSGDYEYFTFDLSHISRSGTITVRFDSEINVTHVLTQSSTEGVYTVTFSLVEVAP